MKKLVALMAVVLATTMAFGNGKGEEPTVVSAQAQTPAVIHPADAADHAWVFAKNPASVKGTVRFWIPFKGPAGMNAMIAEFNKYYPNVTVELTPFNNNTDGNLGVNTALMAGDIDVLASFGLNATYNRWANNMFIPLDDLMRKEGIDLVENWGTDKYRYKDTTYSFPCGGLSYYIVINKKAWDEAGLGAIPSEWTWDEYLDVCRKMTKKDASGNTTVYGGTDYHSINYWSFVGAQVYGRNPYYGDDGLSRFGDPIMKKGMEIRYQADNVEKIWFPLSKYRSDNIQTQMVYMAGQSASAITPNMIRFIRDKENYPIDWVNYFAPWPVMEKGQTNYMAGVSPYSHVGISVNSSKKDWEAIWAFTKFYATYGSRYLIVAGHQSTWKYTDTSDLVDLVFGSEENAKQLIDVDSFQRVVVNYKNPAFYEDIITAYPDVNKAATTYTMDIAHDQCSIDEGMARMQADADAAIKLELSKKSK